MRAPFRGNLSKVSWSRDHDSHDTRWYLFGPNGSKLARIEDSEPYNGLYRWVAFSTDAGQDHLTTGLTRNEAERGGEDTVQKSKWAAERAVGVVRPKMYILICTEAVPDDRAPLVAAHASVGCYLKYQDHPEVQEWIDGPFAKVVCRVSRKTFNKFKKHDDYVIQGESKLGDEVSMTFRPRYEWPKQFKGLQLWRPLPPRHDDDE